MKSAEPELRVRREMVLVLVCHALAVLPSHWSHSWNLHGWELRSTWLHALRGDI